MCTCTNTEVEKQFMKIQLQNFFSFAKSFGIFHKMSMTLLVLGGFLMGLMELAGLSVLFPLLHLVLQPDSMSTSGFIRYLSELTGVNEYGNMAVLVGFLIASVFILKNIFQVIYLRFQFGVLAKWRITIVKNLYRFYMVDYEVFMKRNSSEMVNMISKTIPFVVNNYVYAVLSLLNYALMGIVILGYVIYINWVVAAVIFLFGFGLFKCYGLVFKKKAQIEGERAYHLNAIQHELLQQSFVGYKETRSHLKESFFGRKFLNNSKKLSESEEKLYFYNNLPPAIVELVIMLLIIVIFEVVMFGGNNIATAVAEIGAIVLASVRLIPVINRVITQIVMISSSKKHLDELMNEAVLFSSRKNNNSVDITAFDIEKEEYVSPITFDKQISFQNVSYVYPGEVKLALSGINLAIKPGEFIGITGPSGGGKSTLINIFLGFLGGFKGAFLIDNVFITPDNIRNLRKIVGFVDQQVFLMNVSIAENVAYGVERDQIDYVRVEQSLKKAQLWEYVSDMPLGMNTLVGENGKLLSGGQRQRIAIARAFYRDLKILILDEASASLDVETEYKFFTFLETLKGDLTVIMIAHRLSTLKNCDRVLFIEGGHIAASGTFEELYKSNEIFKSYIEYSQIKMS